MREGRESLRRAREKAGLSTDYVIGDVVPKEAPTTSVAAPAVAEQPASVAVPAVAEQPTSVAVPAVAEQPAPSRDPRLVEGELAVLRAKVRRENAAMVQACAMAAFAGLSAAAVGVGLYHGRYKPVPSTPPSPGMK